MKTMSVWANAGLACWLGLGALCQAQPPQRRTVEVPAQPANATREVQPAHSLTAKGLIGSSVNLQGNQSVGTVDDLVLADNGAVDYLVVRTGGKLVLVPWEAAKFNADRHTAVVNITQQKFQEVPTFTQGNWPNVTDPTYRDRIYNYYGLRPGQERRIERRDSRRP